MTHRLIHRPCTLQAATRRAACVGAPPATTSPAAPLAASPLPALRAFTLLELVIVLAIMATISSIAIGRYAASLNTYRATLAAEKIAADLQWARTRARTSSATRDVTFDVASHAYSVSNETLRPGIATGYDVRLSSEPFRVNIASASFGGSNVLSFDAYGGNSASGTVRITAGSAVRDVQITASGSISIVVR